MERRLEVHLGADDSVRLVGRLWGRVQGHSESASFEYDAAWLREAHAFALDPELPLSPGPFHTARSLFNAFTDPAPDRWGQTLLRRHERRLARKQGRAVRTLHALDFLVMVDDETRLGALRFKEAGGSFLATGLPRVPPLVELPRLLRASTRVVDDEETDDDLRLLLAPGTSLGGARPKASVLEADGTLALAKFPKRDDDWPIPRWEAVLLSLAQRAGLRVPPWRLDEVLRRPVLVTSRFDRREGARLPFMSGLTALTGSEREPRSYLELVEFLRREGAAVQADLTELWKRVAFNVLVSNTDDHLRNHGFLRERDGWRLAPAYDLNPMPVDVRPRVHAMLLDEVDPTASIDAVLATAPQYGLSARAARGLLSEVSRATRTWKKAATSLGLTRRQVDRMSSAFEHADAVAAAR